MGQDSNLGLCGQARGQCFRHTRMRTGGWSGRYIIQSQHTSHGQPLQFPLALRQERMIHISSDDKAAAAKSKQRGALVVVSIAASVNSPLQQCIPPPSAGLFAFLT